ncbi:glycosyltransferase [Acinetobacter lactucae]|uniref:glycosyltransferase n=1 Tax=Acinetobacter lactucae TaxID=1785128 RepID=UPI0039F677E4
MKKILVIGNGDSVFVKDFIYQYESKGCVIDLISWGSEKKIDGVRNLSICSIENTGSPILNHIKIFNKIKAGLKLFENDYDVIVIHSIFFFLAPHMFHLKRRAKKIVSVVWGSDFYRVTSKVKIFFQNIIYKNSNIIVFTNPKTKSIFNNRKKNIKTELRIARFGLPVLQEIDVLGKEEKSELCCGFNLPKDKIKVMVGYNANLAHEQLLVIDQVGRFEKSLLEKIHLIFPLGYGGVNSKAAIEEKLKRNPDINYTILEDFLNFHNAAKLRLVTDILINIQPTDQFSGSMQETLYAGGWVLTGNWLPYAMLMELEPKILLINSKEEIGENLVKLINENAKCSSANTDKIKEYIREKSSWEKNLVIWDSIMFGA